jgi:hypothetical protein
MQQRSILMTIPTTTDTVSRRTALAGIGAGGLGVALAASTRQASAQDATPTAMTGHPIVGPWIVDKDVAVMTDVPSIVVFTADGGLLDPSEGVAGVWQPTGPSSAAWTLIDVLADPPGYVAVRSIAEIDASGDNLAGPYSFTVVGADGTVMASGEASSTAVRLQVEPIEAGGTPIAAIPTWEPAPPADATPTS